MIQTNAKPTNPAELFHNWNNINQDITKSYLSTPYLQSLKNAGNPASPTNNVYVRAPQPDARFATTDDANEILTRETTVNMARPGSSENDLSADALIAPPDPKYTISPEVLRQTETFQASAVKQLVQQFYEAYLAPIGMADVNNRLGMVTGNISSLSTMFPQGYEGILNTHSISVEKSEIDESGKRIVKNEIDYSSEFDTTTTYRFVVNEMLDERPTYRFTTLNFPPYISHGVSNEEFVDTTKLATESKLGQDVLKLEEYKAGMKTWADEHADEPWTTSQYREEYKKEGERLATEIKARILKEVTDKSFDGKKLVQRRNQATYRAPAFKQVNDNINTVQVFFEKCFGITSTYMNEWDLSLYMQEGILSYNKYEYSDGHSAVLPNYVTNLTYGLLDDAPVKENYDNQARMFTADNSRSAEVDDVTPYAGINMAVSSRMGIDSYVTSVKCCEQPYDPSRYPLSHYWTNRYDGVTNDIAGVSQFWLDNSDLESTGEFVSFAGNKQTDMSTIKATPSVDHGLTPSMKTTTKKLHDIIKFDDTWKTMMSGWNSTDVNGHLVNTGLPYEPNAFSHLPYWKLLFRNGEDGFDDCDIYAIDADQQLVYSKIDYANNIFNIITSNNQALQNFVNSKLSQTIMKINNSGDPGLAEVQNRINALIDDPNTGDTDRPVSLSDFDPRFGNGDGSSDYIKVMGCKIPGSNLLKMWMKKGNGASKGMDGYRQGSNLDLGNLQASASPAAVVSAPKSSAKGKTQPLDAVEATNASVADFVNDAQPGNFTSYKVADDDSIPDLAGNMSYGKGVNQWSPFLYGGPHGEWMNPNTMEGYTQFQNELLSWVPTLPTSAEFNLNKTLHHASKHFKSSNGKLYNNVTVLTLGELRAWAQSNDNYNIHKPQAIIDTENDYNKSTIITNVRYVQEYYAWRVKPTSEDYGFEPIRTVGYYGVSGYWSLSNSYGAAIINGNWVGNHYGNGWSSFNGGPYGPSASDFNTLPRAASTAYGNLSWYSKAYGNRTPGNVEPGMYIDGKYTSTGAHTNLMSRTRPLSKDKLDRADIRNSYLAPYVWHLGRYISYNYLVQHTKIIKSGSYGGGYGGYGRTTYTIRSWTTTERFETTADYPYGNGYGPNDLTLYNGLGSPSGTFGVEEGKVRKTLTRRFETAAPSLPDMPFTPFKVIPVNLTNLRAHNKVGDDRFYSSRYTAVEPETQWVNTTSGLVPQTVYAYYNTKGYNLEFDGWGTDGLTGDIDANGRLNNVQFLDDPMAPRNTSQLVNDSLPSWHPYYTKWTTNRKYNSTDPRDGFGNHQNSFYYQWYNSWGWNNYYWSGNYNWWYSDTLNPAGYKFYDKSGYQRTSSDWFPGYWFLNKAGTKSGTHTPAYGWWSTTGIPAQLGAQRKQWWIVVPEDLDTRCTSAGYSRGYYQEDELQTTLKTAWLNGYGQVPVTLPIEKNGKIVELTKVNAYIVRIPEVKRKLLRVLTKDTHYGSDWYYDGWFSLTRPHNLGWSFNHKFVTTNNVDGRLRTDLYKYGSKQEILQPVAEDSDAAYWRLSRTGTYDQQLADLWVENNYRYNDSYKLYPVWHSGYGWWGSYWGWRSYYTYYRLDAEQQGSKRESDWSSSGYAGPYSSGPYGRDRYATANYFHYDYGTGYQWYRAHTTAICQYYSQKEVELTGYTYYLAIDPSQVFWVLPDLNKIYGDNVKSRGLDISPDIVKAYTIIPDEVNAKEVTKDIWPFGLNMLTKQSSLTPLPYSTGYGRTTYSWQQAGVSTPYYLRIHGLWFSDIKSKYTNGVYKYDKNSGRTDYLYNLVYRDGFPATAQVGSDGRYYDVDLKWHASTADTWTGYPMTNAYGNYWSSPYRTGSGLGRTTTKFTLVEAADYDDSDNYNVFTFIDNLGTELCMPNPDMASLSAVSKHIQDSLAAGDKWSNYTDKSFLRYNVEDCFNSFITALKTQLAWLDKFKDYADKYIADYNIIQLYTASVDKNKQSSVERYIKMDKSNEGAFYTHVRNNTNEDENICFEESLAWCRAIYDPAMSGQASSRTLAQLIENRMSQYNVILNLMQDYRITFLTCKTLKERLRILGRASLLTTVAAMVAADADTSRLINFSTGEVNYAADTTNQTWQWTAQGQQHVAYRSPAFATWAYLGVLYQIRRYWSNVRFAKDNGSYWYMRALERIVPVLESQQKLVVPSEARRRVQPPSLITSVPTDVAFVQERTKVADKISNIVDGKLPSKNEVGAVYLPVQYVSDFDITQDNAFASCDNDRILNGYRPSDKEPGAVLLKNGEFWHGASYNNMPIIYIEETEKWAYVPEDDDYVLSSTYISTRKKALSKKFADETPLLGTGLYLITDGDIAEIKAAVLDGNPIKTKTYYIKSYTKPQAGWYDDNNQYHNPIPAKEVNTPYTLDDIVGMRVSELPEIMAMDFINAKNEIYFANIEAITYKLPGVKWRYDYVTTDRVDHYDEYQADQTLDENKGRYITDPTTGETKIKKGQIISGITFNIDSGMINPAGIIGSAPLISQATPEELICSTRVGADYWRVVVPENVSCPPEYMTDNPTIVQSKGAFVGAMAGEFQEEEPTMVETLIGASSKAFSPILECDTNMLQLQTQKAFGDISQAQLF